MTSFIGWVTLTWAIFMLLDPMNTSEQTIHFVVAFRDFALALHAL